MKTALLTSCVLGVGLLTGCASMRDSTVSKFGPGGLVTQPIEKVDLITLVSNGASAPELVADKDFPDRFDRALADLRKKPKDAEILSKEDIKYLRNRIQDRLIMVSNDLCEEYKTVLKRKQSNANFFYGLTSVLAGAAGSVASGARAAGNWAALSGVSSGVRAEHNQDYYADMAAHVITKGIVQKRRVIADALQCARKREEADYTIERAIADTVVYHGACSLVGGLESIDHVMSTLNVNVGTDALSANQFYRPYLLQRDKDLGFVTKDVKPDAAPGSGEAVSTSGHTEVQKCADGS